jgi:hypothetical protein
MAFIIFVVTPASFLMDEQRQQPLRELAAIARQVEQGGEELLMIGFEKPSVVFYTQRTVHYFSRPQKAIAYIEKRARAHSTSPSVLILTESKRLKDSGLQPNEYIHLGTAGAYQLIRVSKQIIAQLGVKG